MNNHNPIRTVFDWCFKIGASLTLCILISYSIFPFDRKHTCLELFLDFPSDFVYFLISEISQKKIRNQIWTIFTCLPTTPTHHFPQPFQPFSNGSHGQIRNRWLRPPPRHPRPPSTPCGVLCPRCRGERTGDRWEPSFMVSQKVG